MRIKTILIALLLSGCVHTAQESPHAKSIEQARLYDDISVCVFSGQGAPFETKVIKERKLNCKKIIEKQLKAELKLTSNTDLCLREQQTPIDLITAEIKSRKLDCYKTLSLYYQQQQVAVQEMALEEQQRQARSAAFMNLSNQIQQQQYQNQMINSMNRPRMTNCYNSFGHVNCTTY